MENELVKKKIIEESIALFMNYGVRSVTMDDIAKHLGMSKKTIYQHFKDKEEIITLATVHHFETEHRIMEEIEKTSKNAVDELYNLTSCIRGQMKNINNSVLYDLKKYYARAWDKYKSYKREVIYQSVIRNMRRGISEGLFRSEINPEILAHMRIGQIEMSFNKEYFPEDKFALVEVHEQMIEHFTYGILSEEGFKLLETYKQNAI